MIKNTIDQLKCYLKNVHTKQKEGRKKGKREAETIMNKHKTNNKMLQLNLNIQVLI